MFHQYKNEKKIHTAYIQTPNVSPLLSQSNI